MMRLRCKKFKFYKGTKRNLEKQKDSQPYTKTNTQQNGNYSLGGDSKNSSITFCILGLTQPEKNSRHERPANHL